MEREEPTCRDMAAFLGDYVAETLPAETRAVFERHLRDCAACDAYVRSFRTTVELTRAVASADVRDMPEDLVGAIMRARNAAPAAERPPRPDRKRR